MVELLDIIVLDIIVLDIIGSVRVPQKERVGEIEDEEKSALDHDAEARTPPKSILFALSFGKPHASRYVEYVEPCIDG
jgi:hypothetical protein